MDFKTQKTLHKPRRKSQQFARTSGLHRGSEEKGSGVGAGLEASGLDLCFPAGRARTLCSACLSPKPAPVVGAGDGCTATQQTPLAHPL